MIWTNNELFELLSAELTNWCDSAFDPEDRDGGELQMFHQFEELDRDNDPVRDRLVETFGEGLLIEAQLS